MQNEIGSAAFHIGDLEYCVGPSGASDAVTGAACEVFVTIFRVGIYFVDQVFN